MNDIYDLLYSGNVCPEMLFSVMTNKDYTVNVTLSGAGLRSVQFKNKEIDDEQLLVAILDYSNRVQQAVKRNLKRGD